MKEWNKGSFRNIYNKNYGTMKSSLDKIFHGEEEKKFFEIEKEGKHQKNGKVKRRKN